MIFFALCITRNKITNNDAFHIDIPDIFNGKFNQIINFSFSFLWFVSIVVNLPFVSTKRSSKYFHNKYRTEWHNRMKERKNCWLIYIWIHNLQLNYHSNVDFDVLDFIGEPNKNRMFWERVNLKENYHRNVVWNEIRGYGDAQQRADRPTLKTQCKQEATVPDT